MSQELPIIPFRKFLISEAISNANSKRDGILIRENPKNLSLRKMIRAMNIRATMPDRNTAKRYIQLYA